MAAARYEANFSAVMPVLRDRARILAEARISPEASATDIARGQIAEVELHLRDGDDAFKRGSYSTALTEFKKARALIYKVLQPAFDTESFVASRVDVALPV